MDAGTAIVIVIVSATCGWLLREVFLYREDERMMEEMGMEEEG